MISQSIKKIFSGNRVVDKIQNEVVIKTNEISSSVIINGRLIKGVLVATSPTTIEHGFGRDTLGYIIVNKSTFSDIISVESDKRKLVIRASVPVTVDIWVF